MGIRKETLARTAQKTAAKKKPAKKKKKKKKAKKIKYGKGGHAKGVHKSKALVAASKKKAAAMKSKGIGLFKKCTCSADLAAITGSKSMTRPAAVKAVGKVFGGGSMFKLAGAIAKHMK